jgi:hypothetical protein
MMEMQNPASLSADGISLQKRERENKKRDK